MNILVLHLSDIHIKTSEDQSLKRSEAIARSLNAYLPNTAALVIAVTGDIAFSGVDDQYNLATSFINQLIDHVKREREVPHFVVVVPGNHDCDFSSGESVRRAVRDTILKEGESGIDEDRISLCISTQAAFERFRAKIGPTSSVVFDDRLWLQYLLTIDGKRILFNCLNVSWMSQQHEAQGKLIFPVERYKGLNDHDADLRVTLLHHPLNWYQHTTYHPFRTLVRTSGNFVLSGHEHVQGASELDDALTSAGIYIEGAALQPHAGGDDSGFNVIDIDLDGEQFKCDLFKWDGKAYQLSSLQEAWSSYRHLPKRSSNDFEISKEFLDRLDDPGANFTHSAKPSLRLSDFYVFPDLEELVEDGEPNRFVSSNTLQNPAAIGAGTVVKGAEKAGKSALLCSLFRSYYEAGFVPILLRGQELSSASEKEISEFVERAVKYQYGKQSVSSWRNLSAKRKIILFDDYDRTNISDRYRWKVIQYLTARCAHLILTADEIIDLNEAISPDVADTLRTFKRFEIRPFGYKLRYDLIKKWAHIGEDYSRSSADVLSQIDKAEKVINTVLGRNLVPRVPLYLLTLLQSLESSPSTELTNSALGDYYHYLIVRSLKAAKLRMDELDEFLHYCSQLAWFFHQSGARELDTTELRGFSGTYSKRFHAVDFTARLSQLCEARLLDKRGDAYAFAYPYIYYFFLGRYLADNLHSDQEVKTLVERYSGHLYVREYANAILFLTYHSRDSFVIDCVAKKLQSLFSDKQPICLGDDTATLNDLVESTSRLVFAGGDPEKNRRQSRELQDEIETDEDAKTESANELEGEPDLSSKLNMLFKTVEILGQILKNHYGRLESTVKIDLMREVYLGPLRALRGFLEAIEADREAIIKDVEGFVEAKAKNLDEAERNKLARRALFEIVGMVTYAFLFKASSAVGSEHLRDIAQSLIKERPSTAFRLIELSSRLDAPTPLPFAVIEKISKDTEQNVFAHRLLETIVLRHLYLFKTKDIDKQRICEILGVSVNYQRQVDLRAKDTRLSR